MSKPKFEISDIGKNCYAINDQGRTVAFITSQGYVDWLLKSPLQDGPLLTSIKKETHLSYTLGLKLLLITPTPSTELRRHDYAVGPGGSSVILKGYGETQDGHFVSETTATLRTDAAFSRYEWELDTTLTCRAKEPVKLPWIEFNNVYPARAGLCMLCTPKKEYTCTLMVDKQGVVWKFPHQHQMHYSGKISQLEFAAGAVAGYFGEKTGSPVVTIHESSLPPDWAICDMYYDLHCGARPKDPIRPGEKLTFRYTIKYLNHHDSEVLLKAARPVPVAEADRQTHDYARFELGMNTFTDNVKIDSCDDASAFKPRPPQKAWDREVGHKTKGSLRITNETREETAWSAEPPTNIPSETKLRISAKVKTLGVEGKGAFIRVRYHTFVWHPTPHIEWAKVLESKPVGGTTPGWVHIEVPELTVPKQHFDYLVWIEFVLDGKGVAWLTEADVDLQPATEDQPILEEGAAQKKSRSKAASRRKPATAGATM